MKAARSNQRGFTLIEVLVALLVFAISVVGLVALEARGVEAQKASGELRDAERVAQEEMSQLRGRGFTELIEQDFQGFANPTFPYTDMAIPAANRLRDFRRPPVDLPTTTDVTGSVRNKYILFRSVDMIFDATDPPMNPPILGTDEVKIHALELRVLVMWIDDTNPMYPPPATADLAALVPLNVQPGGGMFLPYVSHVDLRTIRVNDATLIPPAP